MSDKKRTGNWKRLALSALDFAVWGPSFGNVMVDLAVTMAKTGYILVSRAARPVERPGSVEPDVIEDCRELIAEGAAQNVREMNFEIERQTAIGVCVDSQTHQAVKRAWDAGAEGTLVAGSGKGTLSSGRANQAKDLLKWTVGSSGSTKIAMTVKYK